MIKQLPDKWVRKAIHTAINNCSVLDVLNSTNVTVPCYDDNAN